MAINWTFDPSQYSEKNFEIIPVGDYRARIADVVEKKFKSGNEGYEITLNINGYNSKTWFYLVLDPSNVAQTNQRIGDFFNSFGITDYNMANYPRWKGKVGGVRVKHEQYNGENSAKVAFCLSRKNQDKLPPAKFSSEATASAVSNFATVVDDDDALPFA